MDQYNDAVQHPATAFSDPALRAAKIAVNGMGLPVALGGGFALTYTATAQGRKYAVRCFHKEAKNLESRYSHVATGLRAAAGPYFVGFEYQARGVLVNGQHYPIVKMDWVEGDTLGVFLEDNHKDKAQIERLRTQFGEVERFLRSKGMAHGDLQNGNVLVKGDLKLIDYDGVYVPTLPKGAGTELGHKHFQHPKRSASDFGPDMDRFSFAVIDLSLRALAAQPALFSRYSNGENIVLTANDFLDPGNSKAFADLKAVPNLTRDAASLANICAAPIAAVPTLEDFLAGRNIPAASIVVRAPSASGKASAPAEAAYVGAFDVVDGSDYGAVSRQIGNRVELVGQVVKVHLGRTRKGGRPYAFVFFNQTSRAVRLNIWNDGLDKLTDQPGHGWTGRWLSVQGLVDPPYSSKYGTSVSITITSGSQVRTIPEQEARRRLRPAPARPLQSTSSQGTSSRNADILRGLNGVAGTSVASYSYGRAQAPATPTPPPASKNQALLKSIQPKAPASPSGTIGAGSAPTGSRSRSTSSTPHSTPPPRHQPQSGGWNWWILGLIAVLIFIAISAMSRA